MIKCEAGEFEITDKMHEITEKLGIPFSAGILTLKNHPSLQELMLKKTEYPEVIVNEMAEKAFTYGKDILEKSIVKKQVSSGIVIIRNINGDILGLGKFEGKIVKNIIDLGFYLRNE